MSSDGQEAESKATIVGEKEITMTNEQMNQVKNILG